MKTKSGKPVTDEMLEKWAAAFDSGEWPEGKTAVIGRPSLAAEEIKSVTFKLPVSKIAAIDETAAIRGETRSEFLRSLVDREFAANSR
jgi:hypothetical protein